VAAPNFLSEGVKKGIELLFSFDPEVLAIVRLSLFVSIFAVLIAVLIGVPLGSIIAIKKFPFKKIVIALINTSMGLPPVVVGLLVTLFLARNGPLGFLEWLYTAKGMILAQVIIATPIVTGLSLAAVQSIDQKFYNQILALGATTTQALFVLLKEIRLSILAAVIAGFGSIISEVGAVMMVGGNIKSQTRVLTTAVVLETHMGNFGKAIALGLILLTMSFIVNLALTFIQQHKAK
jgi:tungstate transport system permease protein